MLVRPYTSSLCIVSTRVAEVVEANEVSADSFIEFSVDPPLPLRST